MKELPIFPPTQRDLSLIVDEQIRWTQIEQAIAAAPPAGGLMEQLQFVTTYRGQPVPAGKKSVTVRMTFRATDRTLRDEEINPFVDALAKTLGEKVGATVRTA